MTGRTQMLTPTLENYLDTPIIFLMMIGLGVAVHAFAVSWAAGICTLTTVSYVRSAVVVMAMAVGVALLCNFMQNHGFAIDSPEGIVAAAVVSMVILSIGIPADAVNALLILVISSLVTSGAAFVVLLVCERFAVGPF
jgi:hypothetical protein